MTLPNLAETPAWKQFLKQKSEGQPTTLPDYSHAGYARGLHAPTLPPKTFQVADYGALADDLEDDMRAVQRAIFAAEAAGGGVIQFESGRYLFNSNIEQRGTLEIRSSNIVMKGRGADVNGTVLHSIHPLGGGDPHNVRRLHLGDSLLHVQSPRTEGAIADLPILCDVTSASPPQSFHVLVDDVSSLSIGQRVLLYARDGQIIEKLIEVEGHEEYVVRDEWTNITNTKSPPYVVEIHEIEQIEGNKVVFAEPIHYRVTAEQSWQLRRFDSITDVGVQDLCFMGNAQVRFKHHRSSMDDSGWSMIKFKGVSNGWIQRCSFINVSQVATVALSTNVSMLNLVIDGTPSHHIPRITWYSSNVLGGLIDDRAGFLHGPSVSGGTVGSVFWRCHSQGSLDSHAGRPFISLFDLNRGGPIHSSGGTRDYPQHLPGLTLWNFRLLPADAHEHDITQVYDFWPQGNGVNVFIQPWLIGFHGVPVEFNRDHVGRLESLGQPVTPESLYESQLVARLGARPQWIDQALQDQALLLNADLPASFQCDAASNVGYLFSENFHVASMFDYLGSISLQMYNSKQFEIETPDNLLTMHTDQGLVRSCLYSLMYGLYTVVKNDNRVDCRTEILNGQAFVVFNVESVKNHVDADLAQRLRTPDSEAGPYINDAEVFAATLGGYIQRPTTDHPLRFEAWIPRKLESLPLN